MLGLTFLIAIAILEVGFLLLGSASQSADQNAAAMTTGNVIYILLRVAVIVSFSFLCIRRFKREIYGALSMTGLLMFVDHVVFRSAWMMFEMKANPAAWQGIDPKTALFNSAFSYVVSLPVILLLAFLGALLALRNK